MRGATRSAFPGFIEPCHPTLVTKPPSGGGWLHEIKVDGYRCQLHITGRSVSAFTRRGHDWVDRFQSLASAAQSLPVRSAILDGEIIAPGDNSLSDFAALQGDLALRRSDRLVYYRFDLLYLDGYDLRKSALESRKHRLRQLLERADHKRFLYAEEFEGDGATLQARVCRAGLEGLVSKLRDSPYRSGRSDLWVKVACRKRDTFWITGYVPAPANGLSGLYVGRKLGGKLFYAGKATTGFSADMARELRARLKPLISKNSPLAESVKKPKAVWVTPKLQVDLEYRGVTGQGRLRHASFKGIREDLIAEPVIRSKRDPVKRLSYNIQRVLPGAVAPGKEELREYWRRAGKAALRFIARRPLTLVRHVDRVIFFHTRTLPPFAAGVHPMHFEKREGGEGIRAWVDSVQGLLGLVDMDVVELHPWNATVDDIEHPDQMVFDIDPGEDVPWSFVTQTALALRDLLRREGYKTWPKATGGKGLHVMAPLRPARTHTEIAAIAKQLATRFAAADSRYTVSSSVGGRRNRVFIDYLRNGRGQTAIGTFSPRARPNFPIAAPLSWAEVRRGVASDAFTMHHLPHL